MTKIALNRRSLITGLISLVAAPAIVRAGSLMYVKQMIEPIATWRQIHDGSAFTLEFDGVIAEEDVFSRSVTRAEVAMLNAYLKEKWDL